MSIDHIKSIHGLSYCTGNHPEIKAHYKAGNRPTEFGNKVWATSLVLLNYLQAQPFKLQGLKVLEIGCGWGLLGVYLAKQFQCEVTCSDLDASVLPIVELHARLNQVAVQTKKASFLDLSTDFLKGFDLILGAEVCYSETVAKEISELLKKAQLAKVQRVLIADPGRPDFNDCYELCKKHSQPQLLKLPGSVNGKSTHLLSIYNELI